MSRLSGDIPDIETYLKTLAQELHEHPPPKSKNHLGYLIEVFQNGTTRWGELWTDEPLETEDQLAAWATELAGQLDVTAIQALGFTYSFGFTSLQSRMCVLWRITPRYCVGESLMAEWVRLPTTDKFAKTLWNLIR